jgi:hypothetical protein
MESIKQINYELYILIALLLWCVIFKISYEYFRGEVFTICFVGMFMSAGISIRFYTNMCILNAMFLIVTIVYTHIYALL